MTRLMPPAPVLSRKIGDRGAIGFLRGCPSPPTTRAIIGHIGVTTPSEASKSFVVHHFWYLGFLVLFLDASGAESRDRIIHGSTFIHPPS